jgi:hypothetical protein
MSSAKKRECFGDLGNPDLIDKIRVGVFVRFSQGLEVRGQQLKHGRNSRLGANVLP